jgi:hypothetical protein
MDRSRWQQSLGSILLVLLVVLFACGIVATITWIPLPRGDPSSPYRSIHIEPDGVLILRTQGPGGQVRVKQFPVSSALAAISLWWAVAAGIALIIVTLVASRTGARRRRSSGPLKRPRFTMSRGMVVIGAVSIWLWLSRTEMYWILCGSLVLLLALVADIRRGRLVQEIQTECAPVAVWKRLAIAGYWVAVILALLWIVCVLVWDSLRPRGT